MFSKKNRAHGERQKGACSRLTSYLLMAQLMHISSTAALVVFGPFQVNAGQEAFWYFAYGLTLWIIVAIIREYLL